MRSFLLAMKSIKALVFLGRFLLAEKTTCNGAFSWPQLGRTLISVFVLISFMHIVFGNRAMPLASIASFFSMGNEFARTDGEKPYC